MTGPEHYQEAEKLLSKIHSKYGAPCKTEILAEAQVHATLALAAATALSHGGKTMGSNGMPHEDFCEWLRAAAIEPAEDAL